MGSEDLQGYLDLVDWRRRVGDVFRIARTDGLAAFREARDELFRQHPESPVAGKLDTFDGVDYFPGDGQYRVACRIEAPAVADEIEIDTGGSDGVIRYRRAGRLRFNLRGSDCSLTVFSIVGYGGGLFLPFRDKSSGESTYGGGRYLFDTVKNTDAGCLELRTGSPDVVIDFNYAYNPSCAYDPRWACPLAPQENWLGVAVEAGERRFVR